MLTIQNPELEDEGYYYIIAENCVGAVGTMAVRTTLELYVKPVIQPDQPIIPPEGSCQDNENYLTINVAGSDVVVS